MAYNFFPMIARMKYINRWGLMRNTQEENIQEHSHMVAVLAHALAVIQNRYYGGQVDPGAVAVAALYHDASEILTGDMPTPIKYDNPDIQKLYEEYQAMEDPDVVILGIAAPGYGREQDEAGIAEFLEENGYTYPVLMDPGGKVLLEYGITSYPTTYMIDADGNLFGYVVGQMSENMMRSIIEQTVTGVRVSAGK